MKKYFLGAAAALAVAVPGVAAADTNGFVGLNYATLDDSWDSDKDDAYGLNGAVVTNIGGAWNLQFDAAQANMTHGDHNHAYSDANVHAFYRTDAFAVGGVFGYENNGDALYSLGVEGQYYLPRFTLSGSYTYQSDISDDDFQTQNIAVDGQFFIMPNLAVGGGVQWVDSEWAAQDGYNYSVNAEYQLANSPLSFGASYTKSDLDSQFGGGHYNDVFGVFARWNFGTPDLQTRSTSGASLTGGADAFRGVLQY